MGVPKGCTWQVLEYVQTTLSDCHLNATIPLFEAQNPSCFGNCSTSRYSPCWNSCMFDKVLPDMPGASIASTWAIYDSCVMGGHSKVSRKHSKCVALLYADVAS